MKSNSTTSRIQEEQLGRQVLESFSKPNLIPSIFNQIFAKYYSQDGDNVDKRVQPSTMVRMFLIRLLNGRVSQLPAREQRLVHIIQKEEEFFFDEESDDRISEKITSGQLLYLLILSFPHRPNLWRNFTSKLVERIEQTDGRNPNPRLHYIFTFERFLFSPPSTKHPRTLTLSMDRIVRIITQKIASREVRIHLTRSLILSLHQHFLPYLSEVTGSLFPHDVNNRWSEKLMEYIVTQSHVYRFCSSNVLRSLVRQFVKSATEKHLQVISQVLPFHVPAVNERSHEIYDHIIHSLLESLFLQHQRLTSLENTNLQVVPSGTNRILTINPMTILKAVMDSLFSGFRRSSTHQSIYLPRVVRCLRMIEAGQLFSHTSNTSIIDVISIRTFSARCLQRLHSILHPISHPLFVPLEQSEVEQIFGREWSEIPDVIEPVEEEEENIMTSEKDEIVPPPPPVEEKDQKREEYDEDEDDDEEIEERQPSMIEEVEEEEEDGLIGQKRKSTTKIDDLRKDAQEIVVLKKRKLDHEVENSQPSKTEEKEKEKEEKEEEEEDFDGDITSIVNFDEMGDDEDFKKLEDIDFE